MTRNGKRRSHQRSGQGRASGTRRTFGEIVADVGRQCDERLFSKARTASQLAKVTRGRTRDLLYRIKHRSLDRMIKRGRPVVHADMFRCPGLLSVGVRDGGRLHTHERWMEAAAA